MTPMCLFFERHRHSIDLGGQDKIVLGQAADRVSPDFDRDIPVARQMQIGMMILFFRDLSNTLEKPQPRHEIEDAPFAANPFAVRRQLPFWHRGQKPMYLFQR